jgi:PAS domain-containing protein
VAKFPGPESPEVRRGPGFGHHSPMESLAPTPTVLPPDFRAVFGDDADPIAAVEARARALFPEHRLIVWEGDPQTFAFSHVGGDAEAILGWPCSAWTRNATFWVDEVVHPDDRRDAVAYCALATGKARDHVFEYRARRSDGNIVWLSDYVRVVPGPRGVPMALRGLMFDISARKREDGGFDLPPQVWLPPMSELGAT